MRRAPWLGFWLLTNASLALYACGSRTGFSLDDELVTEPDDAATDALVRTDASRRDVFVPPDSLPPIDSRPNVDVRRNDCPDADATLVYVISSDYRLYSFYPPTATFVPIGQIACPSGATPYSMAVDRKGKAYVVFTDGRLFQVSTSTAACVATAFVPGQSGFRTFGMGFVSNTGGPEETLFVAEGDGTSATSSGIAAIDTTTFKLGFIGGMSPPQSRVELTGTGDGRLFGYSPNNSGSKIIQIDKTSGNVVGVDPVAAGGSNDAFAFAFWGGDFWIFTGPSTTGVYRYRATDKTTTFVTNAPALIVGAGVSTCAPQ